MPLLKKQKQPSLQSQLRQQCRLASFQLLVSSVHQQTEDKKQSLLFQLAFWSALLFVQICRFSGLLINLFHTYSSADASHCPFRPTSSSSQELSAGGWSQRCDCSRQSPSWQFNPTPARTQQNRIIIGVKGDLVATSTGELAFKQCEVHGVSGLPLLLEISGNFDQTFSMYKMVAIATKVYCKSLFF